MTAKTGASGQSTAWAPMASLAGSPTWQAQPDDYTTAITSATAITLPDIGYRLVRVYVESGTTPGSFQINPDGITQCHFPCPSNGTTGNYAWAVLWSFQGTSLPAALFTFNGGISRVVLTFSKGLSRGPDIYAYRAIRFTVTTSATHSTGTAFSAGTYSVAPAVPVGVITVATYQGGTFLWPQIGTAQSAAPCDSNPAAANSHVAPNGLPKATTLTPLYTNSTAAGTIDAYVGYLPKGGS
jgi:hypothetical protein